MASSRVALSFYLLTFAFLLQTAFGTTSPLFHICSTTSANFTTGDLYSTNLKWLTDYLSFSAPLTGFGIGSLGLDESQAYGLALCRGDMSAKDCKACLDEAKIDIHNLCPNYVSAIVWYDNCLLKYSDQNFLGQIDNQNRFTMFNTQNAGDAVVFNKKVKELMGTLSEGAYKNSRMFAFGELEISGTQKLYGMTQCTRDLSSSECKVCLENAIGQLPSCCGGKLGGRVVGGSCSVGCEIYPFINA